MLKNPAAEETAGVSKVKKTQTPPLRVASVDSPRRGLRGR